MLRRGKLVDHASRFVALVAGLWYGFTALWGLFGIPAAGHLGAGSAGNVMAAEQMLKWRIIYPAWEWYSGSPPDHTAYICHHPFGQYWIPAFFLWIFGHHDFVARLPGALMSAPVPLLLYGIAKERWGRASGAVAAASYAVLPIAVGFSQFTNLEAFCIFGALLFFWGHTRHLSTGKRRYVLASYAGLLVACCGDWAGYLLVMPAVAWCFLRGFVLPERIVPRFAFRPYAKWWGVSVGIVAGTLMLWLALFTYAGQIDTWVMSALARGGGTNAKLKTVLEARKDWIDFSFTPLVVKLGKLAAPVALLRLVVRRVDEEVYSLSLLFGATFQYVAFKGGADVHIFWSMYFAPYYALAMAQLFDFFGGFVGFLVSRFMREWRAPVVAWVGLLTGLVPVVLVTPDGVRSLPIWRRTGGRYDDNGKVTRSQLDLLDVVDQEVLPKTYRGNPIDTSNSAEWYWEHTWLYQGPNSDRSIPGASDPTANTHPFWIARPSGIMADGQKKVAPAAHIRVFGDVWLVDQREPYAPIDVYPVEERDPSWWQWLFLEGTEPHRVMGVEPDPWLTWEVRTHLDEPATEPRGEPKTLDEMRIAQNVDIDRGDLAAAERTKEAILARLDRSMATRFDTVELLGVRMIGGPEPRLETWFQATDQQAGDAMFFVTAKVEAKASYSLIPVPAVERTVSFPPPIPTKLWHTGFIYRFETVLNHRIGRERYTGHWVSRDGSPAPVPVHALPMVTLAVVE
ncbi:MAG TPA: glycosyltransferase family 39 protein [Polyangiaceae bacterium]|jgi:hypothetical protein